MPPKERGSNDDGDADDDDTTIEMLEDDREREPKCRTLHRLWQRSHFIGYIYYSLQQPIVEELTKHFNACCIFFCCSSGPLLIVARTPVSGYTPGQSIRVELELTNNSNENVSTFVLQILRVKSTSATRKSLILSSSFTLSLSPFPPSLRGISRPCAAALFTIWYCTHTDNCRSHARTTYK